MTAVPIRRGRVISLTTILLIIWLAIGAIAAAQRHPITSGIAGCSRVTSTVATIVVGPLNYAGVDPAVSCRMPQPSK